MRWLCASGHGERGGGERARNLPASVFLSGWAEVELQLLLVSRPNLHKFAAEISVAVNVGECAPLGAGDAGRDCREAVVEQRNVLP
jgi:hypothetical protein